VVWQARLRQHGGGPGRHGGGSEHGPGPLGHLGCGVRHGLGQQQWCRVSAMAPQRMDVLVRQLQGHELVWGDTRGKLRAQERRLLMC
jgi:hypothetical protein